MAAERKPGYLHGALMLGAAAILFYTSKLAALCWMLLWGACFADWRQRAIGERKTDIDRNPKAPTPEPDRQRTASGASQAYHCR